MNKLKLNKNNWKNFQIDFSEKYIIYQENNSHNNMNNIKY